MEAARTALRLLMAELACANRALQHGDILEARRAIDAALVIDPHNVQALEWRAELDRGSAPAPRVVPIAPTRSGPARSLGGGGWFAFEQRVRERRARHCVESARAALAGGDDSLAREAIDELAILFPDHPDLPALQRQLPEPVTTAASTVAAEPLRITLTQAEPLPLRVPPDPVVPVLDFEVPAPGPALARDRAPRRSRFVPVALAAAAVAALAVFLTMTWRDDTIEMARQETAASLPALEFPGPEESPLPASEAGAMPPGDTAMSSELMPLPLESSSATGGEELVDVDAADRVDPPAEAPATTAPAEAPARTATAEARPRMEEMSPEPERSRPPPPREPVIQQPESVRVVQPESVHVVQPQAVPATAPPAAAEPAETGLPASLGSMAGRTDVPVAAPPPLTTTAVERETVGTSGSAPTYSGSAPTSPAAAPTSRPGVAPAAAAPRVDPAASAEAAVRQVLQRYVAAYNRLDASAARAVWPGVDRDALQRAFSQLETQTLRFDRCTISVDGEGGSANCAGQAQWVPRVGDQDARRERRTWRFDLSRNGDDWIITRAEARR